MQWIVACLRCFKAMCTQRMIVLVVDLSSRLRREEGENLMKANEIRKLFIDFFANKEHYVLPSHSLIPDKDDKTLLWINSGMAPLKKYYSKQAEPPAKRMVNSQKCIRTNDIENVGKTDRHQTMFEMLGSFSIGDYFKKEAIVWAWEFLTEVVKLDPKDLVVTINPEDEEAYGFWINEVGLSPDKIYRDPDNFWEIGLGPCGPDSEIYYDKGAEHGCQPECRPGCDECSRFLEIWNLVFTQYNREADGSLTDLPYQNIDTGMGLERLVSVIQETPSNYETDLFMPIIQGIETLTHHSYNDETRMAMRVIADHLRSVTFAVADGAMPSNEGRGYIIRRLLRRAVRYGRTLGLNQPFLHVLVNYVVKNMEEHYTYLSEKQSFVERIVLAEEERFLHTLEEGEKLLNQLIIQIADSDSRIVNGQDAFQLYDTYGFPLELTIEMAGEANCTVDIAGFNEAMEAQRQRARSAFKGGDGNIVADEVFLDVTDGDLFTGYTTSCETATVLAVDIEDNEGVQSVKLLLEKTPFYATSGGQSTDYGRIYNDFCDIKITNVRKLADGRILHEGKLLWGTIAAGDTVEATVDENRRQAIRIHHTCTHLLHKALKNVLGNHINQAGSDVSADRLRFDFTHFEGLTEEELNRIQEEVNEQIFRALPVITEELPVDVAIERGATALFGEKYGDKVRVVSAGDYSMELCGGTHLTNTGEAGFMIILSEGSIGSGIRRIEAIAGKAAYQYAMEQMNLLQDIGVALKVNTDDITKKIQDLQSENTKLLSQNQEMQQRMFTASLNKIEEKFSDVEGIQVLAAQVEAPDMNTLRQFGDTLRARNPESVIALGSTDGTKVFLIVSVSDSLIKEHQLHTGQIIKEMAKICGGGGGGRPNMAQAGGKNPAAITSALESVHKFVIAQKNN